MNASHHLKGIMKTTFACVSDVHMLHEKIDVPDADVFVCAGDLAVAGTLEEIREALRWISNLPHRVKILVPGNHDVAMHDPVLLAILRKEFRGVIILVDETVIVEGLKIHGSPWVPGPYRQPDHPWAFDIWSVEGRMSKWSMIPDDVDVLITHGPAVGSLDLDSDGLSRGCVALEHRISRLPKIKLHVFGHIHPSAGTEIRNGVVLVNAAIAKSDHEVRDPFVVSIQNAA